MDAELTANPGVDRCYSLDCGKSKVRIFGAGFRTRKTAPAKFETWRCRMLDGGQIHHRQPIVGDTDPSTTVFHVQ